MIDTANIYLDNNASTRVDPIVVEAMLPYFTENFANPSSSMHYSGSVAAETVKKAQRTIARYLNVICAENIIFTSGATESNNMAIKGIVQSSRKKNKHIITSEFEHESVLEVFRELETQGVSATYIPVSRDGYVSTSSIEAAITEETVLVSIMAANNEIGTIQPIQEIGDLVSSYRIPFHTDATQLVSTGILDLGKTKADLVTFSAHKIYGPKGVGGLYINTDNVRIKPQMQGGNQQFGLRSGTLNVPGIVGMASAFDLLGRQADEENYRIKALRDSLLELLGCNQDIIVNGSMDCRLPSNLNVTFPEIPAIALAKEASSIMFSAGSACSSANGEISHVLRAIGVHTDMIPCSVRLSLGRFTTRAEIVEAATLINEGVTTIRKRGLVI